MARATKSTPVKAAKKTANPRKPASKKAAPSEAAPVAKPAMMLVLRTCNADMTSHGGFKWPASGEVVAPDWNGKANCGGGLHGLPWGEGDGSLLSWSPDAKWLVVEVVAESCLSFDRKCKFERGVVVYCGDRMNAAALVAASAPHGKTIVGLSATAGHRGTATAGHRGTATAGHRGTATAGYGGTATAGDRGTATAGYRGTATAGDRGTATAGYGGTATAGDRGQIRIAWWDYGADRLRITIGYIGESDLEKNVKYQLDSNHVFVRV